ncbi:hypothetical protein GYA49_00600 [Candidatus Beckwithbacteria bacterium]|nr:hypothetical protein [Candidatus Beckwithbacteria bacterium]
MPRKKTKYRTSSKKSLITKLILAIAAWLIFGYVVLFVEPKTWVDYYYAPFFILLVASLSLTINIFISKMVFLLLPSLGLVAILVLRLFGFRDWINPLFIVGLVIALIYFFTASETNVKLQSKNLNNQSPPVPDPEHANKQTSA